MPGICELLHMEMPTPVLRLRPKLLEHRPDVLGVGRELPQLLFVVVLHGMVHLTHNETRGGAAREPNLLQKSVQVKRLVAGPQHHREHIRSATSVTGCNSAVVTNLSMSRAMSSWFFRMKKFWHKLLKKGAGFYDA